MKAFAVDHAIDVLARRQHGVFSRAQATAVGASPDIRARRLLTGTWLQLAPGVYALPSHPGTWRRALMAAVLGERSAVVGGRSAAALHGLAGFRPGHPEIVVPPGANCRSPLARVRRCGDYRSAVVDHVPVLTVCDTFFSVAGRIDAARLAVALDDGLAAKLVTVDQLQRRYLGLAGTRRPGLPAMAALLDERGQEGFVPPESVLEGALYRVLDRPGMPAYRPQVALPWAPDERVDAVLCTSSVILEADGRRWHTRVADFSRDRRRDRVALAHGHPTVRFTFEELTSDPDAVARDILAVHRCA